MIGKTRTRFTVNSLVFVILFWFLAENFKLSARTKDVRDTRDAFLESVYPCIDVAILKEMIERKEVTQIKWTDKKYQLADSLTKKEHHPRVFAEGKL